jgi:hypothetical protein
MALPSNAGDRLAEAADHIVKYFKTDALFKTNKFGFEDGVSVRKR